MPGDRDVQRLLVAASQAKTLAEQQRLVGEAEKLRNQVVAQHTASRELDLANAVVRQHITPAPVHEMHTEATDWIGGLSTTASADVSGAEQEMTAQGTVWYGRVATVVKADTEEFETQAQGMAHRLAGAFGEHAERAEAAFVGCVQELRARDMRTGALREAASGLPQVGEGGYPAETMVGLSVDNALPVSETTSERAPAIQELEANGGAGASQDVTQVNDPGLGEVDNLADGPNGDAGTAPPKRGSRVTASPNQDSDAAWPSCPGCGKPVSPISQAMDSNNNPTHQTCIGGRKESSMHIKCPTCGQGRVAARVAPQPSITDIVAGRHVAYSGLPQVDQVANADDSPGATPLPPEVAFPWVMEPGQQNQAIAETEQQIAEREQRKGASKRQLAEYAAKVAFQRVMAGQDDSGWLGDMGQGGVAPGEQDGGNQPSSNLGAPDPVYGQGGDNGNQPLKPYGADEANDYTNNPGQMWQHGQPAQMDLAGRGESTQATASRSANDDPEIQKALAFVRQRRAAIEQGRV